MYDILNDRVIGSILINGVLNEPLEILIAKHNCIRNQYDGDLARDAFSP